jgi:hypothetical protein
MQKLKDIILRIKDKVLKKMESIEGTGCDTNMPAPKFGKQILKSVIGETRANQVLQSMSMNIIPKVGGGSMTQGLSDRK